MGDFQTDCKRFENRTLLYGCGINNWYAARYQCRKQNMDLVIIRDQELKQYFHQTWNVVNKNKCMDVFVGIRRDDWVLDVNRTDLTADHVFSMYWKSNSPAIGDCATVFRDQKDDKLYWKTQKCSARIPAICVKGQKYTFLQKGQATHQIPTLDSEGGYNPGVAVWVTVTCLIVVCLIIGVVIFIKRKKVKSDQNNKTEGETGFIVRYVISDPCRDKEDSPEDETLGIDVDTTGGSLQHRDSGITLDVPSGAVPDDQELRISLQTLSDLAFYQSPPKGLIYISPIIKVQMRPVTPLDYFAEKIPHRLPRENIHVYHKDCEQEQWSESNKFSDSREAQNRLHHEVDSDKVRVKFKRVYREGIHIVSTCQANLDNVHLHASIYAARKRGTNGHFRLFTCVYHSMHELPLSLMREQLDGEGDYEEANVNEEQTLLKSGEQYPPETGNPDSIYVHLSPMELFKVNAIQTPTATLEVRSATDNENWRIDQDDPHHSIPVSALLDGLFPWVVVKYRAVPKDGVVDLEEFMVDQIISLKKSDSISPNDEGSPSVKWKFKVPVKKEYVKLSKAHIETEDPLAATDKDMQDGADLVPAASENKNDAATDPTNKDNNKVPVGFPVQTSVFKQEIASGTQDESDRTPIQVPQVSTIDLHPPKMTTTEGQNQPEEYMDSKEESPSAEERITSIIQDETKDLSPPYSQETLEEIVCTEGRDTTMELVDERPKKSGEKEKVEKKEKKKKKK